MSETSTYGIEEKHARRSFVNEHSSSEHIQPQQSAFISGMSASRLYTECGQERCNSSVRAEALQSMQQQYGNRSVQRFTESIGGRQAVAVQRLTSLNALLTDPFRQLRDIGWGGGQNGPSPVTGPGSFEPTVYPHDPTMPSGPSNSPENQPVISGNPADVKIPGILGHPGATIPLGEMIRSGEKRTGHGEANRDIPGVNVPSNDVETEEYDPFFPTFEQELENDKMGIDSFWDSAEERKAKKADYEAWEAEQAKEALIKAEAQRKRAAEREELRKTDPELAQKLDRQESVARAFGNLSRNMGDVELSAGKSSVGDEVLGKATAAIDNPLGTAAKAVEYAQNPTQLGVDAGKAVFGAGEATVGPDGKPRRGPSLFDRGLNEAEQSINNSARSAADTMSDIPIVGSMVEPYADSAASYVESQTQITAGGLKAVGNMAGGMSSLAADPEGTAKMAWKMGENGMMLPAHLNPFRLAHAGYDLVTTDSSLEDINKRHLDTSEMLRQKGQQDSGLVDGMVDPYKQSWEQGRYGEMAGRAMVDIGSMLFGGGAGGRAGAAGKATGKMDDLAAAAGSLDDAGRVNPYGKTMLDAPSVNPYGKTLLDAPSVNPYGKTMLDAPSVNPYGQTMLDAPSVNPYGKTMPVGPMKRPQNVMEMDALPPDYYPGMPQPSGWRAGPYGSHGPAPVNPHSKTLPGVDYDPFPNPIQVPVGKGPVNPYGSTMDIGTGPGNPAGQTWLDVGRGGVDPYGRTVNLPATPDGLTMPGYGARPGNPLGVTKVDAPEFNPYAQTQPMPANPYGVTQPGMTPISPSAPTVEMPYFPSPTPTLPGIGPDLPLTYHIPGMGGAGNSILSTWEAIKSLF